MKKIIAGISGVLIFAPKVSLAHCPLCTIGAGALAVLAASLGISTIVVGIFTGAFALALGVWLSKLVKKAYVPFQDSLIIALIYFSTIIPIMPFIREYRPLYVSFAGGYGTFLHNTYTVNLYIAGALLGLLVMLAVPTLSQEVTKRRNGKHLPFQGLIVSFTLLILLSLAVQFLT